MGVRRRDARRVARLGPARGSGARVSDRSLRIAARVDDSLDRRRRGRCCDALGRPRRSDADVVLRRVPGKPAQRGGRAATRSRFRHDRHPRRRRPRAARRVLPRPPLAPGHARAAKDDVARPARARHVPGGDRRLRSRRRSRPRGGRTPSRRSSSRRSPRSPSRSSSESCGRSSPAPPSRTWSSHSSAAWRFAMLSQTSSATRASTSSTGDRERREWVDTEGNHVSEPTPTSERAVTYVERAGLPVAAVLHDPALDESGDLVDGVTAAAGIAIQNGRLHAELRARGAARPDPHRHDAEPAGERRPRGAHRQAQPGDARRQRLLGPGGGAGEALLGRLPRLRTTARG